MRHTKLYVHFPVFGQQKLLCVYTVECVNINMLF